MNLHAYVFMHLCIYVPWYILCCLTYSYNVYLCIYDFIYYVIFIVCVRGSSSEYGK